jgi:S-adenosylmethionine/arginine decarboxylase-like enzyme
MSPGDYGKELILDLCDCEIEKFSKEGVQEYFNILCDKIKMEQAESHFWEFPGEEQNPAAPLAHLKGTSALQFIKTSSVVVHTVDELKKIYINIFSCKDFDDDFAASFTRGFFKGRINQKVALRRT